MTNYNDNDDDDDDDNDNKHLTVENFRFGKYIVFFLISNISAPEIE